MLKIAGSAGLLPALALSPATKVKMAENPKAAMVIKTTKARGSLS